MRRLITSIALLGYIMPAMAFEIIIQPKLASSAGATQASQADSENLRLQRMQPLSATFLTKVNTATGFGCTDLKAVANGARVIDCGAENLTDSQKQSILKSLNQISDVNYAEENTTAYPLSAANNYNTTYQWDMVESMNMTSAGCPSCTFLGDNFFNAWNNLVNNSGNGIVVAVIDTGYTQHPAFGFYPGGSLSGSAMESGLTGNESGYGYDFVTSCYRAATGESGNPAQGCTSSESGTRSPQPNALDLGDAYIDIKGLHPSSWHGTLVQGIVNGQGVSESYPAGSLGGASGAKVLPVRVLGRQGGDLSDIINGMYWAAGFNMESLVSGVTTNTSPANVINMSIGATMSCGNSYQQAINDINNKSTLHTIIVVAAGNESSNVSTSAPANCSGVISVAALGPTNLLASYTNYGNTTIAASGGDVDVNPTIGGVYWPTYASLTTYYPVSPGKFTWAGQDSNGGTSSASPHVAATVAMLLSVNPSLTESKIINILQASAKPVANNGCSTYWSNQCLTLPYRLNAANALKYVQESILVLDTTDAEFNGASYATATITNNNPTPVTILTPSAYPVIGGFTATTACLGGGNTLAANGGYCTITLNTASTGTIEGYITVANESGINIAVVGVTGSVSSPTTLPSGGCSAVKDGSDYSLIMLLGMVFGIYVYRRYRTKA